jgi:uncharacterized membrane protein YdjX (TVP38/TMEM64 family)
MRAVAFRFSRIRPWQWIALGVAMAAAAAGAYVLLKFIPVHEIVDQARRLGPIPFFGALAVLPAFGMPVTPFYLVAAEFFGRGVAVVGVVTAITINVALTYALGRWLLHPVAEKLVAKLGYRIPVVHHDDRWAVAMLLRITPGPPFFVQSYLLALARVPFGVYMIVSVGIPVPFGIGFVLFGEGLMQGSSGGILIGASLLGVAIVAVRFARKKLRRRPEVAAVADAETIAVTEGDQGRR